MKTTRGLRFLFPVLVVLCLCVSPVDAQPKRIVPEPPLLGPSKPVSDTLMALPESMDVAPAPGVPGETPLDLNIVFTPGTMYNPATNTYDKVRLRSYQGKQVDPKNPFISPRIEVDPGDTIRITLHNQLDKDPSCTAHGPVNTPHCFNGTNLHTHGLWVNPAGNGDNVLISINPGVSFQYEYKIPPDHPAGTFWYHTHRHGSTALQVSSGMAGALIVRGSRPPEKGKNGDLDTLLPRSRFPERVVVLQQIQYTCHNEDGTIKRNPDGKTLRCDPGDTGEIKDYNDLAGWSTSGRYTSINGQVLPTFEKAKAGRIERWRVIHGGVRDTVALQFREMRANAPGVEGLQASKLDEFVGANCTGNPLLQHVVATDGLALPAALKRDTLTFQPGYRFDTLVVFPKPGRYCVIDSTVPIEAAVEGNPPTRALMGFVDVEPGTNVPGDVTAYVTAQLAACARDNMPVSVKAKVEADIKDGLKLTSFVAHADIPDGDLGDQTLEFTIDGAGFGIGGKPYDPMAEPRKLVLDTADQWKLTSARGSHPFHIHVNPFQVVKILNPDKKDVSGADATDGTDSQYPGLKGAWKDTLWVKGGYEVYVRSRYQRYIGDFVLHCHILDHEDRGMMQGVRIVLPDGSGGAATVHGGH
jgi:L-ascorbate oxidase